MVTYYRGSKLSSAINKNISGYEVIRNGQAMSVRTLQPEDIVIKTVTPFVSGSGGRSGGANISSSDSANLPMTTKASPTPSAASSAQVKAANQQAQIARAIRAEANRRGIDISTSIKQNKFIRQLQEEAKVTEEKPQIEEVSESRMANLQATEEYRQARNRYLEENPPAYNIQTRVEMQGQRALEFGGQKILKLIPEGKTKKILSLKVNAGNIVTDTLKFGFFMPFLATGQEVLSKKISTGELKPIVETKFKTFIDQSINEKNINVRSVSKSGGAKAVSVSIQSSKGTSQGSISTGDVTTSSKEGGLIFGFTSKGNKFKYIESDIVGISKNIGKARITDKINIAGAEIKVSRKIGQGIESMSWTKDISKAIQRRGIAGLNTKTPIINEARFNFGNVKFINKIESSPRLTGVLMPTKNKNVLRFLGTTEKPIIRISSEGITKRINLENINVVGTIKTGSKQKPTVYFGNTGQGLLTQDIQINPISSIVVPVLRSTAKVQSIITKQTPNMIQTPMKGFSAAVIPKIKIARIKTISSPAQLTPSKYSDQTASRFGSLGILGLSNAQRQKKIPGLKIETIQINLTKERQREALNLRQELINRQSQRFKQALSLRILQVQKQTQRQRTIQNFKFLRPGLPKGRFMFPSLQSGILRNRGKGLFGVSLRRYGKFKTIGTGLTLGKAFEIGRGKASRTLGATFRIEGLRGKGIKAPYGFYSKPSRQGLLFIEQPKFRLSKRTEVIEIQASRRSR